MSGRYVRLAPGRYTLNVRRGHGPAGVQRAGDRGDVIVGIQGGRVDFEVDSDESAYYWWRGPNRRPGVRLLGVAAGEGDGDGSGQARRRWTGRSTERPDPRQYAEAADMVDAGDARSSETVA